MKPEASTFRREWLDFFPAEKTKSERAFVTWWISSIGPVTTAAAAGICCCARGGRAFIISWRNGRGVRAQSVSANCSINRNGFGSKVNHPARPLCDIRLRICGWYADRIRGTLGISRLGASLIHSSSSTGKNSTMAWWWPFWLKPVFLSLLILGRCWRDDKKLSKKDLSRQVVLYRRDDGDRVARDLSDVSKSLWLRMDVSYLFVISCGRYRNDTTIVLFSSLTRLNRIDILFRAPGRNAIWLGLVFVRVFPLSLRLNGQIVTLAGTLVAKRKEKNRVFCLFFDSHLRHDVDTLHAPAIYCCSFSLLYSVAYLWLQLVPSSVI